MDTNQETVQPLPVEIDGSFEPYLTVEQLAEILKIRPRTVADWTKRFVDMPVLSLPGSLRFRASEVIAWLKSREKEEAK